MKKLFTTEDGVNIYEGDNYYFITSSWKAWAKVDVKFTPETKHKFSTIEKAQEYILMNKPCLSIEDVINCCFSGIVCTEKLKELVANNIK